jgi:hypothetical protein
MAEVMPSDLPATTRLSAGYSTARGAAPIKTNPPRRHKVQV